MILPFFDAVILFSDAVLEAADMLAQDDNVRAIGGGRRYEIVKGLRLSVLCHKQ